MRTGPISLGKQPDKHHASILTHVALNSSPYNDALAISGRFGYWGRVIDSNTGETTPFLSCSNDFVYSAPAPSATVFGSLIHKTTAVPIPGVDVTCGGKHDESGLDGVFTILLVPAGAQVVSPDPSLWDWVPDDKHITVPGSGSYDAGPFEGEELP
jgi:hypothetical protein